LNFEKYILKLLKKTKTPGVALALIEHKEIKKIECFGFANIESSLPITNNSIFQIASISKPLTAWGVMKLVEMGKLDLDAPVEKYLTRWHIPKTYETYILKKYCKIEDSNIIINHDDITIRRILSHSAGLNVSSCIGFHPFHSPSITTIEDNLNGKGNLVGDLRVIEPPGTAFRYSGGGYTLLQLIIEEVTGKSFEEFMEFEILKPLGMKMSSFRLKKELESFVAIGYNEDLYPLADFNSNSITLAAGGCYSTVEDMAHFVLSSLLGLEGGTLKNAILKCETIQKLYEPIIDAKFEGVELNLKMGLGHFILNINNLKVIYHAGSNQGFRSAMAFIPQTGDGIVILTNGNNGEKVHYPITFKWIGEEEKKMK
jgi:CubicO group peptidase (beta-lactamase class C family)